MSAKKIILVIDNRLEPQPADPLPATEPKNVLKGSGYNGIFFITKQLRWMQQMREKETPIY